jgi:hypothetical protein
MAICCALERKRMPVLIVSDKRPQGRALEQLLLSNGLLNLSAASPSDALALASVLRFRVAVFYDPVSQEAAHAMQEMEARYGTRLIALLDPGHPGGQSLPLPPSAVGLTTPVDEQALLEHIARLRGGDAGA